MSQASSRGKKKKKNRTGFESTCGVILDGCHWGWVNLDERLWYLRLLQEGSEVYLVGQEESDLYIHILDIINGPMLDL
jgi:hypothetical protein